MISFTFSFLAVAMLAFSRLCAVSSVPVDNLSKEARDILARATPAPPHWVIYADRYFNQPPPASTLTGYNVFILSFLLHSGPADDVQSWAALTAAQRASIQAEYHAAGISLIASAFGSTDTPTSSGVDPIATANYLASFILQYNLDGIDIDYEDFTAFHGSTGSAETWLIALTKQLRTQLPVGQYILTHAPIAAWFPSNLWSGGGYYAIDQAVGNLIDWYNLQYYSQNADQYVTCTGLLDSATQFPGSALFEIAASGVPLSKLVIGKPATASIASDYMDPNTLATCVQIAQGRGWTAGVMVWEYPDAGSSWITTVRSLSWPVSGGTPPPISSTATSTAPGGGPTNGICTSIAAWSSSVAYVGGSQITYNGHLWTAKWWTQADIPGGAAGVWTDDGPC